MSLYATMDVVTEDTAGTFLNESRHISVWVDVTSTAAYAFASDIANLPRWAAGLDLGAVSVEFSPPNAFGVLDHVVRMPDGPSFYNPMRVIPGGGGQGRCEVVFTVRRRPGMTDDEFMTDAAAVEADLQALRRLLEAGDA